ncbi:TPA: transglycosylase SLT domain-containing protein [Klebsiella variicola]|nr:transglycosylase SLT domain-containing protein [Klebsiella variicola]SSL19727.1 putative lytic transglycosylase [Klebsiella pneumoniae]HCI6186570.1 transglycosylase SLT domain-containing protein [Klebsiella variicola subsp. variicola]HCL6960266.1 transglycosylase SLT domain-containing protein [Klebsiella variicola]HDZ0628834.1 transglycosylase SLT domain-containing protein [Klebsiella pneumoniae]
MRKQLVLATLLLISTPAWAADCFDMAGRDYRIDPDLLRAISWQESKWKVNAIGKNPGAGYGAGLMQIDSQHQGELSQYGIKPGHLLTDACLNIYTGAYYLALAFKKWGVSWEAVGAYNAGFRRTDRQAMRRLEYARKIEAIYLAIKKNKNAGQSSLTTK